MSLIIDGQKMALTYLKETERAPSLLSDCLMLDGTLVSSLLSPHLTEVVQSFLCKVSKIILTLIVFDYYFTQSQLQLL